ncbi:hypothetical protein CTA2_4733, partial [Colletotrichum tanaceti]
KSVPRKLDSERCQLCRQHKLKVTPLFRLLLSFVCLCHEMSMQPLWPRKCDRCLSVGLECSPGEVKRRARRPIMGEEEEKQNGAASEISSAPAMPPNIHKLPHETWGNKDLLHGEYEIHHTQRTLPARILDPQTPSKGSLCWDISASDGQRALPYVSSLHQSLPLLKDKLSVVFNDRLAQGDLSTVDRTVLEAALVDLHTDLPRRPIMGGHDAVKSYIRVHAASM